MPYQGKGKIVPRAQVDPAQLKRLTDSMLYIDEQKAELSGERGEYAKEARDAGIHPRVHAFLIALLKLSPAERHLALDCFDSYRAALKLDAWQHAGDPQSDIEDRAA